MTEQQSVRRTVIEPEATKETIQTVKAPGAPRHDDPEAGGAIAGGIGGAAVGAVVGGPVGAVVGGAIGAAAGATAGLVDEETHDADEDVVVKTEERRW